MLRNGGCVEDPGIGVSFLGSHHCCDSLEAGEDLELLPLLQLDELSNELLLQEGWLLVQQLLARFGYGYGYLPLVLRASYALHQSTRLEAIDNIGYGSLTQAHLAGDPADGNVPVRRNGSHYDKLRSGEAEGLFELLRVQVNCADDPSQ
jgi:hypothetical protein